MRMRRRQYKRSLLEEYIGHKLKPREKPEAGTEHDDPPSVHTGRVKLAMQALLQTKAPNLVKKEEGMVSSTKHILLGTDKTREKLIKAYDNVRNQLCVCGVKGD